MMILPALSISIRAISTPAAVTAFSALVTSCCRNVDDARAITTTEMPAYRPSVEITARHRRTTMLRDVALVTVVRLALGPGGHADGVGRVAAAAGELPLRRG